MKTDTEAMLDLMAKIKESTLLTEAEAYILACALAAIVEPSKQFDFRNQYGTHFAECLNKMKTAK